MHYGNADQSRVGTARFRFQHRGVHGFQRNTVCLECIAAVAHCYPGDALVPGRSRVNRHSHTACAYAHRFGRDPAGAFRLQTHRCGFGSILSGCRQGAAALYRNIMIRFVRIVSHADGHSQKRRRNADHIAPALDRVGRFQRQITVCRCQRSVIHRNTGAAFGCNPCIPYADPGNAGLCLHGTGADRIRLVIRHVALRRRQRDTPAFDGGICNRNIILFIPVIHHVGYVDRQQAQ